MAETPEDDLKDELIRKLAAAGIKADRRYSVERLEEMLGNVALEVPNPQEHADPEAEAEAEPEGAEDEPASEPSVPPQPSPRPGDVRVRITKFGSGKVYKGQGDERFVQGDETSLPIDIAQGLEARGFAEIIE